MNSLKSYNVCFIGRTGNGKTTLINKIFETSFSTDPLVSCTKALFSMTQLLPEHEAYDAITVYDTPGIGEYSSHSRYWKYYEEAISKADCVVLVTTFDRTDAPVQRFLRALKPFLNPAKSVKFVVALNHIDSKIITDSEDKYAPWDLETNLPTEECLGNIEERINIIKEKFNDKFLPFEVIPVCAARDYNVDMLKNNIYEF